jgi:hypothetical protein
MANSRYIKHGCCDSVDIKVFAEKRLSLYVVGEVGGVDLVGSKESVIGVFPGFGRFYRGFL